MKPMVRDKMDETEPVKAVINLLRRKNPVHTRLLCRLFYMPGLDVYEPRIKVPTEYIPKLIKAFESAGFECGPQEREEVDNVTIILQDLLIEQQEEDEFKALNQTE